MSLISCDVGVLIPAHTAFTTTCCLKAGLMVAIMIRCIVGALLVVLLRPD